MKTIRVFLVDDERLVRHGLRMRLSMERDLTVVGEAADGVSAMSALVETSPDVVVMDVELPEMDGIATAAALQAAAPQIAIVMLSLHDDPRTRARAAANGAAGFVSKQANDQSLIDAIRAAASRRNGHGGFAA
jgi:DNA-binding NarL/FixJ family response regulator